MTEEGSTISHYREAVRLIEAQRRLLTDARAPSETVDVMIAIIKHLHSLPDYAILRIIDGPAQRANSKARKSRQAAEAANMSLGEIEEALKNDKTSRSDLEAIAVGRFQVPSGSLRSFGGIDQLREKIVTLVQNERAHETIGSVAKETRQ